MGRGRKYSGVSSGVTANFSIFVFLIAPAFFKEGALAVAIFLLIAAVFMAGAQFNRLGRRVSAFNCLLSERLSGSSPLCWSALLYILCCLFNLLYSPIRSEIAKNIPIVACGALLWLIISFYVHSVDRLDNLLMSITASGILLAGASVCGLTFYDEKFAASVMLAALCCGTVFLLTAEYRRLVKATVVPVLCAVNGMGIYFSGIFSGSAYSVGATDTDKRLMVSSGFSLLREFSPSEMILGRGSGYDISVSGFMGVQSFPLSDLLNGGMLRFTLSLILWLSIIYCLGILFLYRRGVPIIYLSVLGWVFIDSIAFSRYSYITNPVFLIFCCLLVMELTLLKKGKARFPCENTL